MNKEETKDCQDLDKCQRKTRKICSGEEKDTDAG